MTRTTLNARLGILGAAVSVFSKRGFGATRVEDLLEAAGIARRTFYKYFRSKEDVLAGVYELATRELLDAIDLAGTPERPLDGIRSALDVYLDYHADNARLLGTLVQQAINSDSPLAPFRQKFRAELVDRLDAAVHAATGKRHDTLLYVALVSALEGVSLELLGAAADSKKDVVRAKRVMHQLLDRAIGLA